MRKEFPFEKLEVWQDARKLVRSVYECAGAFPSAERFGLASQLTRASVSVANNLAEGSGCSSLKDQAHFSNQAYDLSVRIHNLRESQLRRSSQA